MKTNSNSPYRTIRIVQGAPRKPDAGAPCNGCGVCCLVEPCPVGMLISGKRHGACEVLRWDDRRALYRCGLIGNTGSVARVLRGLSAPWRRHWAWFAWPLARMARRWIAAGAGCDCHLESE